MGLINLDNYVTSAGVEKAGTYISFANETLYLTQGYGDQASTKYIARANYRIYWDKAARDAGKSFIDLQSITAQITVDQLNENLYSILYSKLSELYPNHSDEVRAVEPVAPVEPAPSVPAEPAPSVPAEPTPAEPTPAEPTPAEPAPSVPAEPTPAESTEPSV